VTTPVPSLARRVGMATSAALVVDFLPVAQKPLTASALAVLELFYRLNVLVMATEEKASVEWAAERILGVRKARAYAILRQIGAHADLEAWLRQKVLVGMGSGRIGRGRQTRPSALADAFLISFNGSESPEMAARAGWIGRRKPLRDQALDSFRTSPVGSKTIRKSCHYCHLGRFFRGVVDLRAGHTLDTVSSISEAS
jgi:hypothetical protein